MFLLASLLARLVPQLTVFLLIGLWKGFAVSGSCAAILIDLLRSLDLLFSDLRFLTFEIRLETIFEVVRVIQLMGVILS